VTWCEVLINCYSVNVIHFVITSNFISGFFDNFFNKKSPCRNTGRPSEIYNEKVSQHEYNKKAPVETRAELKTPINYLFAPARYEKGPY